MSGEQKSKRMGKKDRWEWIKEGRLRKVKRIVAVLLETVKE